MDPSGENTGAESSASFFAVSDRGGAEASAGTTQMSELVDQAAPRSTILEANATSLPSLVIAICSSPPKGLGGAS